MDAEPQTNCFLRTELRSKLEPVELAWDVIFHYDNGPADRALVEQLIDYFRRESGNWVLVGAEAVADYLIQFAPASVSFERVTVPATGSLAEAPFQQLIKAARERCSGEANVFLCLVDRFDAHRVQSALGATARVHTFDVLKDLVGERIPPNAWRKKYEHEHIYPIEMPSLEIRKGLDCLLLDLPARSLAQLPIGFAYVYKAVRQAEVNVQAIDVDLIAYHRYHARRCFNYLDRIHSNGMVHPEDPWQAENYIVWTDKKFVDYFADVLDELTEKIIEAKPKVVGLSLHQTSTVSVTRVVERLREAMPDVYIIVGGMSCYQHFVAQRIFPLADYVVVGEADTVVGPLVAALARGERPSDVPGVISRYDSEDREYVAAPLPHNLDVAGGPDYGFTNLDWYVNWNGYRLMPLVGSRGCGWSHCTFCAERFNWRARTPELVAEEIEYYTTRGFRDFVFNESDFNSNPSFVIRLCREIVRRGVKANFTAQLRIGKDCDFEYYRTMKEAGFSCLRFGVDGLSENTLKLQRKGYTKEMVMQNLKHCHDLGIYTEINVVIGVPGETDEDVEESADFIIQMKPYIGRVAFINPLMLFVGSVYYFEPERHKIKFNGDKDELYRQYFVSLPDSSWYSEEPYIDQEIRRKRFFRIVEKIHSVGVPLGAFAKFTADYRKEHGEDSHTMTQQKPAEIENGMVRSAPEEISAIPKNGVADSKTGAMPGEQEKTEFQKTFYGSWSSVFLSGPSSGQDFATSHKVTVVKIDGLFYLADTNTVINTDVIRIYAGPKLLRSYKGYNLVGYRDEILAAPQVLGPLNLVEEALRSDPRILKARTEEDAIRLIDAIEGFRQLGDRPPTTAYPSPQYLRSYSGYNLVGYQDEILAAPQVLGPLNLAEESVRSNPRILKAKTEDEATRFIDAIEGSRQMQERLVTAAARVGRGAHKMIRSLFPEPSSMRNYKDYNLISFRNETYAVPLSMGRVDLHNDAMRADRRIIRGATEKEVVHRIDEDERLGHSPGTKDNGEIRMAPARNVNMKSGVLLRWGK